MVVPECLLLTEFITDVLREDEALRARLRAMLTAGASSGELTEALAGHADEGTAETIRHEYYELPESTVATILTAWMAAENAGRPFVLRSSPPAEPIAAARKRRVEISIAMDEDGVVVSLSHVWDRHADCYKPVMTAA